MALFFLLFTLFLSERTLSFFRDPFVFKIRHKMIQARSYSETLRSKQAKLKLRKGLPIPPMICEVMTNEAVARAHKIGLKMISPSHKGSQHIPFSLFPNSFPKSEFQQAVELAPLFNLLFDRVACDNKWLMETLQPTFSSDNFTEKLASIMQMYPVQDVRFGLHRSDYMLHSDGSIKQVEFNTIASSFGCTSALTTQLHNSLLPRFIDNITVTSTCSSVESALAELGSTLNYEVPPNPCCENLANALASAHKLYVDQTNLRENSKEEKKTMKSDSSVVVVFLVQKGERNLFDQKLLERELESNHGISVKRLSLDDFANSLVKNGRLFLDQNEVSVVYFRAGYSPIDYPSESEWEGRMKIEQARKCIKCPTLAYQLAGSKIVQQRLCEEGQVERFMMSHSGASGVALLRSCFTEMHSLSRNASSQSFSLKVGEAVLKAMARPEDWVIKPQREGGGNNLYGENVRTALWSGDKEKLGSLVLMSRIRPPPQPAILVREERPEFTTVVSELGIYGVFLALRDPLDPTPFIPNTSLGASIEEQKKQLSSNPSLQNEGTGKNKSKSTILINSYAGHLLRTKKSDVDEGGVASGYGVLSSPLLV